MFASADSEFIFPSFVSLLFVVPLYIIPSPPVVSLKNLFEKTKCRNARDNEESYDFCDANIKNASSCPLSKYLSPGKVA